jgi:hypothetical protein
MATTLLRRRGAGLVVAVALLVGVLGALLSHPAARPADGRVATVAVSVDHGVAVIADGARPQPMVAALLGVLVVLPTTVGAARARAGSVRGLVGAASVPERRWWARKVGAPPVRWC